MAKVVLISEDLNFHLFKQGDEKAFAYFFEKYNDQIVGFCMHYIFDRDKSNSIAQEAFINLWLDKNKINKPNGIKAFLYTSARSACLNLLRHKKVVKRYQNNILNEKERLLSIEALQNFDCDTLMLAELEEKIENAILGLPKKCRIVFEKSRKENMKNKEISEELGISVKAVEGHMTRALRHLKSQISEYASSGVAGLF